MSPPRVSLRLLGVPAIDGGRDAAALLTRPKRFAVLAWLTAAQPAGPQRRDRALVLFWPEQDDASARNALRQSLHAIRAALGEDALVSRGDDTIGVNPTVVASDVAAFHEAVARGHLARALELYRGDLLDGLHVRADGFERWLAGERDRLREAAADAAWSLASKFESGGDPTSASRWARRTARLARTDERRVRRVLQLLDRAGDRAGAVQVYEEFAAYLREEFDVEPSEETRRLIAAVRRGAASA
ncbi:MAG TPA: BTAD domain-containing putative transcriptional regulator [Gemmatimonadaceae bacterium]|nr:BTAD domain-containing putative transcriptional regulator [Gemmatimonadaceae bacterium]